MRVTYRILVPFQDTRPDDTHAVLPAITMTTGWLGFTIMLGVYRQPGVNLCICALSHAYPVFDQVSQ